MSWLLAHLLPFIGPVGIALKGWVPSFATIKGTAVGLLVACVLAAGGYAGWTIHSWSEAPRIEKAKKEAVARAAQAAHADVLSKALKQKSETLDARERSLEESRARETELAQQMEALRAKTFEPDAPVLLADDPWLRDRPPAGAAKLGNRDRSEAGGVPKVRRARPGGS